MTDTDARAAIADVMARYPDLTIDGFNGHRRPDFEWTRAELLSETGIREFGICCRWLRMVPRRQKPNLDCDSYRIKHVIEEWAGTYIPNGACIAAAVLLDVPISMCPSALTLG